MDLVIWNEDPSSYRQALQDAIMGLIMGGPEAHLVDKPGGVFVRRSDQMSEEDRVLMLTVARVVLTDGAGTLAEQVERRGRTGAAIPRLTPVRPRRGEVPTAVVGSQSTAAGDQLGEGRHSIVAADTELTEAAS